MHLQELQCCVSHRAAIVSTQMIGIVQVFLLNNHLVKRLTTFISAFQYGRAKYIPKSKTGTFLCGVVFLFLFYLLGLYGSALCGVSRVRRSSYLINSALIMLFVFGKIDISHTMHPQLFKAFYTFYGRINNRII